MKFTVFENVTTHQKQSVLIDDEGNVIVTKIGKNGKEEKTTIPKAEQAVEGISP